MRPCPSRALAFSISAQDIHSLFSPETVESLFVLSPLTSDRKQRERGSQIQRLSARARRPTRSQHPPAASLLFARPRTTRGSRPPCLTGLWRARGRVGGKAGVAHMAYAYAI